MSDVLCWSDHEGHLFELLAGARQAAGDGGRVHAATTDVDPEALIARGADVVHKMTLPDDHPGTLAQAISDLAGSAGAKAVVIGADKRGKAFAGLVAARLEAAYAAEVSAFGFDDGKPKATRMLLSGNTNGTLVYDTDKIVVTANPKTWEAAEPDSGRNGETQEYSFSGEPSKVELVKVHETAHEELNLAQASIVVGAGRGIKKQEDLKMLEDLASALGGALGCSRPLAADLQWLGEEHWIGLSGNEIKPRLYIAAGISGQIQHITGCRGAKTLVAINTDEDAPIFEHADYGIVGDVYDVVPKLVELVKQAKS